MNIVKINHLPEPKLIFEDNQRCYDPKFGLLLHGPCGWRNDSGKSNHVISAGVIGTKVSIGRLKAMLERMRNRIVSEDKNKPWKREFPGLGVKSPLHFDIQISSANEEVISRQEESQILALPSRDDRIIKACEIYEEKLNELISSTHPRPTIIFYPLSRELVNSTKDPRYETEKIIFSRRKPDEEGIREYIPLFDFHHFLKVIGFPHNIPSQVILPSTLDGLKKQDFATIAWNFSVAAYYKATHTPWKLADLDEETCYVGISFYDEVTPKGVQKRAAMAHVYLRTGESQIIRGKSFSWEGPYWKSPHLDSSLSSEILSDVVNLYRSQKGKEPARVVIHKSSDYVDEEKDGFSRTVASDCYLDLVHIFPKSLMRFYLRGSGFPPLRGTLIYEGTHDPAYLYTTGYLPGFSTYMGSGTPWPLEFFCDRLDTDIERVANDIMALTKLDWNNTDFCISQPVTISVSRKVGEILAESRARDFRAPQSYSYYM